MTQVESMVCLMDKKGIWVRSVKFSQPNHHHTTYPFKYQKLVKPMNMHKYKCTTSQKLDLSHIEIKWPINPWYFTKLHWGLQPKIYGLLPAQIIESNTIVVS